MKIEDNLDKLIDALRSEKYVQGKGKMKFYPINDHGIRHCPLGVACEVFIEERGSEWQWRFNSTAGRYHLVNIFEGAYGSVNYPPTEVLNYFGIDKSKAMEIAKWNDKFNYTLGEIANEISKYKEALYGNTEQS